MDYKTIKPEFTAETLMSAIPSEVVELHKLVIVDDCLHIGYATMKLSEERTINNSTHIVQIKAIKSVVIGSSLVWLHLDDWGISDIKLNKLTDKVNFTLKNL